MNRFIQLIYNEFVKLFARPLIFILIISIPLMSLGYAFILKSASTSYFYSESPESLMQNRINDLTKIVVDEYSDSGYDFGRKPVPGRDFPLPGMDPTSLLEELEMLQYARAKGYEPDSWKLEALYKALRYKLAAKTHEGSAGDESAQLYLQYSKAVEDIYAAVERDDLLAYYDVYMRILNSQTPEEEYEKAIHEAEKTVLQLRIDRQIPTVSRFSGYGEKDWQNKLLSSLYGDISNLKQNKNDEGLQLTDEERQELEAAVAVNTYRIKHGKAPIESNTLYGFLHMSSAMVSVISLFIIVIAATMMASEYSQGTIKLLLISPFRRWKLFFAKLTTVFLVALLLLVVLFASSVVAGGAAFGFDFSGSLIKYQGGRVVDYPYILACLLKYLLACPELLVMTSLSIMLAVVMRRSALAIGVGVGMLFGGSIITTILIMLPYDFKRFLLFLNTDLSVYFPELNISLFSDFIDGAPKIEDMSLVFSLAVLAVHFICFTYIALDSFNRRDVKQA